MNYIKQGYRNRNEYIQKMTRKTITDCRCKRYNGNESSKFKFGCTVTVPRFGRQPFTWITFDTSQELTHTSISNNTLPKHVNSTSTRILSGVSLGEVLSIKVMHNGDLPLV